MIEVMEVMIFEMPTAMVITTVMMAEVLAGVGSSGGGNTTAAAAAAAAAARVYRAVERAPHHLASDPPRPCPAALLRQHHSHPAPLACVALGWWCSDPCSKER